MEAKTICVNCKHHRREPSAIQPLGDKPTFYHSYCTHPNVLRPELQNPVTGEWGYAHKIDDVTSQFVNTPYPYCLDINYGDCPMYEDK